MPSIFSNFSLNVGKLKNDKNLNENGDDFFDDNQEMQEKKILSNSLDETHYEEQLTSPTVKVRGHSITT